MSRITTSAPGKLLLFGDHSVVYGHPCIVTAVNQRVFVTLETRTDDLFVVAAPDLQTAMYQKKISNVGQGEVPKSMRFLEAVYKQFRQKYAPKTGLSITTKSDFSATFGFGSSSAVSVAFAKALSEIYDIPLTNRQIFELVYQAILSVQGVGSGFDIAAAIWGGTLYYVTPAKIVEPLNLATLPLIVGYTGVKADTPTIVKKVAESQIKNPQRVSGLFTNSSLIVDQAKAALLAADWYTAGKLMNQNQTLLAELGVSSPILFNLIAAAKKAGALGAKLSGAGVGDCMIALYDPKNIQQKMQIETALSEAGGQVIAVQCGAEGARVE